MRVWVLHQSPCIMQKPVQTRLLLLHMMHIVIPFVHLLREHCSSDPQLILFLHPCLVERLEVDLRADELQQGDHNTCNSIPVSSCAVKMIGVIPAHSDDVLPVLVGVLLQELNSNDELEPDVEEGNGHGQSAYNFERLFLDHPAKGPHKEAAHGEEHKAEGDQIRGDKSIQS